MPEPEQHLVKYDISDAAIAQLESDYMPLTIEGHYDNEGYKRVYKARQKVKGLRINVEKTRKELKADALAYGRRVDEEARRLKERLLPIEENLQAKEDEYNAERERIRAEKERVENERVQARVDALYGYDVNIPFSEAAELTDEEYEERLDATREAWNVEQKRLAEAERIRKELEEEERKTREAAAAKLKAEREALERLRSEREAEEARLQAEHRAEEQRLREERERIETEHRAEEARIQAERDKLEAERKAIENEKRRAEEEQRRQTELEKARVEAAQKALKEAEERAAREVAEKEEAERRALEAAVREERVWPDGVKLRDFADALIATERPDLSTPEAQAILENTVGHLRDVRQFVFHATQEMLDNTTDAA